MMSYNSWAIMPAHVSFLLDWTVLLNPWENPQTAHRDSNYVKLLFLCPATVINKIKNIFCHLTGCVPRPGCITVSNTWNSRWAMTLVAAKILRPLLSNIKLVKRCPWLWPKYRICRCHAILGAFSPIIHTRYIWPVPWISSVIIKNWPWSVEA